MLTQKTVAVVGGAGFIGSHLVDQLVETDVARVVVVDNFSRGCRANLAAAVRDPRVAIVEGDIQHPDVLHAALSGCDTVFHLAALWLLHCQDFPRAAFRVNIEGTFNVLEACRDLGVSRLVYSSSASVYGDAQGDSMDEDHPLRNRSFYGATKIAGEQMCLAFAERYGLGFVGLRYMNVFGPRQPSQGAYSGVVMSMLDAIESGSPLVIHGDGSQTFDFVYVEDAARANLLAAKTEAKSAFYNVGTGRGTTILELAQLLLEFTGSDLPLDMADARDGAISRRVAETSKAERDLGFRAEADLQDGLRRLVEWKSGRFDTRMERCEDL